MLNDSIAAGSPLYPELFDADYFGLMSDYPKFDYLRKQIVRVGEELSGKMVVAGDKSNLDHYREVFRIAYNWRNSHIYPMRRIHHELMANVRQRGVKLQGFTSARLKRMQSIREKLGESSTKFDQMQDLGGCRAIMDSVDEYRQLIAKYREGGTGHRIRNDTDYFEKPRASGYRGHHFVLEFQPEANEYQHKDRRIEVQLRTGLQHAWATAVEAVGIMRRENMKRGIGDPDWLRLFALMSTDFAIEEDGAHVPGTPEGKRERHQELRHLNDKLNAVVFLENINQAFDYAPVYRGSAKFYLVQIDRDKKEVHVTGYNQPINATEGFSASETGNGVISVLAEVNKIEDLMKAFPNYFMDVQMFTDHLKTIVFPDRAHKVAKSAAESVRATKKKSSNFLDLSWLKSYRPQR
ncbi:RelA/SpoT domain-containing protein [Mesorhizobium sp. M0700]|uniref:RelA/SpoT domain-containing protein n=1 Tax=Mesorhizobium sp. M0700 TaxID=2956988 RepID=UPI003338CF97